MTAHLLGPSLKATICTPNLALSIAAWQGSLRHHVHSQGQLSAERAAKLNAASMVGAPCAMLANELDEPWLELIEHREASTLDPFRHSGWLSLEISVADVEQLRSSLDETLFKVIGEPASLDVSDDILAMQVIGPAGEVLYLTEVKAPVPPFELPFARCAVDRLFIPVILTENRDATAALYEQLNGHAGLKFDTKITVINQAWGFDFNHRHPVCALQLAGSNLIEIDQLQGLRGRSADEGFLPTGIVAISFAISGLADTLPGKVISRSQNHACLQGNADELIELIG